VPKTSPRPKAAGKKAEIAAKRTGEKAIKKKEEEIPDDSGRNELHRYAFS
jgi:hypothetical protein